MDETGVSSTRTKGLWQEGESRKELRENTAIMIELWDMVRSGLLEMGVNSEGESVYWPTTLGCEVLGMRAGSL